MENTIGLNLILLALGIGIAGIILLTVRYKLHAFFALLLASFAVGLILDMPFLKIFDLVREGFGQLMKSLGLIIILGTALGALMEHSKSTDVIAHTILKWVGEKKAALSISLTGYIAGLPLFCDSGYIVLNGLNKPLSQRSGLSVATLSVCLATGLYVVHCLVPPHPGVTAASMLFEVDFGKLMLVGIAVSFPTMLVAYFWSQYAGKKYGNTPVTIDSEITPTEGIQYPSVFRSFVPIIVPIVLIGLKSVSSMMPDLQVDVLHIINILGEPAVALAVGVILALVNLKDKSVDKSALIEDAISKAGVILLIIGAGGAFGAVLASAKIGDAISRSVDIGYLGIWLPFLFAAVLKTAQGSSTVAVITTASIVLPILGVLELDSAEGRMLTVLAMGAGSMMVSHANDSYFWVISKFSKLEMNVMLKVFSTATILMGLTAMTLIYVISLVLL